VPLPIPSGAIVFHSCPSPSLLAQVFSTCAPPHPFWRKCFPLVQNHKPVCQHKLSHLIKALLFQVKPVNDLLVTKSNNGLKFYSKSIFPKLITQVSQLLYNIDIQRFVI
jgi:hypothetical protein